MNDFLFAPIRRERFGESGADVVCEDLTFAVRQLAFRCHVGRREVRFDGFKRECGASVDREA